MAGDGHRGAGVRRVDAIVAKAVELKSKEGGVWEVLEACEGTERVLSDLATDFAPSF